MYAVGKGVPQNYAEAFGWFRKAAEQDEPRAQFKLGVMYEGGVGVTQNIPEALKWYRRSARLGDEDAPKALQRLRAYDSGS